MPRLSFHLDESIKKQAEFDETGFEPTGDDDCSAETVVSFKYRTTGGSWADYDPGLISASGGS